MNITNRLDRLEQHRPRPHRGYSIDYSRLSVAELKQVDRIIERVCGPFPEDGPVPDGTIDEGKLRPGEAGFLNYCADVLYGGARR